MIDLHCSWFHLGKWREVVCMAKDKQSLSFSTKTKHLALILSAVVATTVLNGCSIKDETEEDLSFTDTDTIASVHPTDDVGIFIEKCNKCILGDFSELDSLIETYTSTYTNRSEYGPDAFKYQYIEPTLAFEGCAQKALLEGNRKAFDNMFIRQGRIARISRYFYSINDHTQGAFWLQRLVNVKGEVDAYEIAGRIFIQDMKTIGVGVRLLERSARLGNRNARQMLLGLMNPGSSYYQQITRNDPSRDEEGANGESADGDDLTQADTKKNKKNGKRAQKEALANNTGSSNSVADADQEADTSDVATTEGTPTDTQMVAQQAIQTPLEAIASDEGELNTPMAFYEKTASTSASAGAGTNSGASVSAATSEASKGNAAPLNAQQRNRLANAERLQKLEAKAEAARQNAQQRTQCLQAN